MASPTSKNELTTPVMKGIAMYACVHTPNTAHNENKYSMDLLLDKEGVAQAKELGFKIKKKKTKEIDADIMDAEDIQKTERFNENLKAFYAYEDQGYKGEYISIKLQAEKQGVPRKLTIVDAKKNVVPKTVLIGNGSVVKVKFIVQSKATCAAQNRPIPEHITKYGSQAYFIPGDSATMQVIDLVEFQGAGGTTGDDGFETEKGGFDVASVAQEKEANNTSTADDSFPDDDIPF